MKAGRGRVRFAPEPESSDPLKWIPVRSAIAAYVVRFGVHVRIKPGIWSSEAMHFIPNWASWICRATLYGDYVDQAALVTLAPVRDAAFKRCEDEQTRNAFMTLMSLASPNDRPGLVRGFAEGAVLPPQSLDTGND